MRLVFYDPLSITLLQNLLAHFPWFFYLCEQSNNKQQTNVKCSINIKTLGIYYSSCKPLCKSSLGKLLVSDMKRVEITNNSYCHKWLKIEKNWINVIFMSEAITFHFEMPWNSDFGGNKTIHKH